VHRHSLLIEPAPAANEAVEDYFGNASSVLTIEERHSELVIQARSTVEVVAPELPVPADTTPWEQVPAKAQGTSMGGSGGLDVGVLQYVSASRHTRAVRAALDYARPSFAAGRPILEAALDLTRRIHGDFAFDSAATDISTPVAHVLKERRGVCQDFAHLGITCLRTLGLPARYVSGYLLTRPPEGKEKLVGSDASHAWVSVWCPGHGWVDLDPTNNLMPGDEHITIAWGRDYGDVSPIKGLVVGGGGHKVEVSVDVAPENGEG
jgi:transglutaminase-like putative cysteine protease